MAGDPSADKPAEGQDTLAGGAGQDTAPGGEAKPEEKPAAAPEPFAFDKVKLPEGLVVPDELKTKLTDLATEHKLTPEALSPFVQVHQELMQQAAQAQADAWQTVNEKWQQEIKSAPEFTGEKLNSALAVISSAMNEYGSKEAREAFDFTSAGNNPHIFRMIYNMSKALAEGKPATGGTPTGQAPANIAQAFYPNMKG